MSRRALLGTLGLALVLIGAWRLAYPEGVACGVFSYRILGTAVDARTGEPLAGVQVFSAYVEVDDFQNDAFLRRMTEILSEGDVEGTDEGTDASGAIHDVGEQPFCVSLHAPIPDPLPLDGFGVTVVVCDGYVARALAWKDARKHPRGDDEFVATLDFGEIKLQPVPPER